MVTLQLSPLPHQVGDVPGDIDPREARSIASAAAVPEFVFRTDKAVVTDESVGKDEAEEGGEGGDGDAEGLLKLMGAARCKVRRTTIGSGGSDFGVSPIEITGNKRMLLMEDHNTQT